VDEAVGMRLGRIVVVSLVLLAVSTPVAVAFGFDDGVKPPRGIVDRPYSFAFKGRNGCPPYSFVVQNGSLPPGLTMTPGGVVTGVPATVGSYSFWVELRDSGCRGGSCPPAGTSCSFPSQRPFTIDVVAPLSVVAPSQIVGENGVRLPAASVRGTGGRAPYIWELTQAPDWLLFGSRGALSGMPSKPGRFQLAFAVTDHYDDRATADTTVIVRARLSVTTVHLGPARVGRVYTAPIHTNGGIAPFRWKVTSGRFPSGLRLDTGTGIIKGTPQSAGRYALTVRVADRLGVTAAKQLVLLIPRHARPAPVSR
jgi:Putative Ig domain